MKESNEYEQQAQSFLNSTNTEFKTEFLKYDKHFNSDQEKRNIFKITLSNKKSNFSFNFGSSIVGSSKKVPEIKTKNKHEVYCGIKIGEGKNVNYLTVEFEATSEELHKEILSVSKMNKLSLEWEEQAKQIKKKVGSRYIEVKTPPFITVLQSVLRNKRISLYENKVYADIQQDEIIHPTAYSVLACLTKYDPETFENFCSEFGYDEDSRKALKIYEAVKDEYLNLCSLFNEKELELLMEIQ